MAAMSFQKTDDEIRRRQEALETATKKPWMCRSPSWVCADAVDLVDAVAKRETATRSATQGSPSRASRRAAGAALNVLINLPGSPTRPTWETRRKTADLSARVGSRCTEIYEYVLGRLEKGFD